MIKVVSDTVPNYPPQAALRSGLELIPVYVTFGGETLRDTVELSSDEFYMRLKRASELPTTSQPSVRDFEMLYQRIATAAPDATILSIHLSAAVSGTIESARAAAARLPDVDIRIFDTRQVGLGHGLIALEAARMASAGSSLEAIVESITAMRGAMRLYMVLDTLEYLEKGGRIGRAARLLGTLLDMKPILTLRDGVVEAHDRQRSRSRAIEVLVDLLVQDAGGKPGVHLGVMHAACPSEGQALAMDLRRRLDVEVEVFAEIGPALGVYVGPGTVGAAWYYPGAQPLV